MRNKVLLDTASQMRAIERMCSTIKLRLSWLDDGDDQPRTDMINKVVYLPRPNSSWTDEDYVNLRAFVWHEVGHHHPSQDPLNELMKRENYGYNGPFGFVLNALDDVWQEMVTSREYIGGANDLDAVQAHFCRATAEKFERDGAPVPPKDHGARVMGLMYRARSEWQLSVSVAYPKFAQYVDISNWEHLVDRINGIIDHDSPAEELIAIAKEMFDADNEQGNGPSGEEAAAANQKANEKSESKTSEEGKGKGEGEGEGEGEESSGARTKEESIIYDGLQMHDHVRIEEQFAPLRITYANTGDGDNYTPWTLEETIICKATELPDIIHNNPKLHYCYVPNLNSVSNYIEREYDRIKHTATMLRRLFQASSQTSRRYQQQRGKLVGKHLPRAVNGDPRLFSTKSDKLDSSAEVYMLVDGSASMAGSKYQIAAAACVALSEALSVADVKHKIAVFSDLGTYNSHLTIKEWSDRFNHDNIVKGFASVSQGGNADGDNIVLAGKELRQRRASRQIMLVLSDGQPCSSRSRGCDDYDYTKRVIENLSQLGVEMYGIGLQDYTVKNLYPEHCVISKVSEVPNVLADIVKRKLL